MDLFVQIGEIIIDDDIEKLKKFLYNNQYIFDGIIKWSLNYASIHGKLNIIKYLLNNYSDKITDKYIEWSLKDATYYNNINVVKYIELYKIIRKKTVIYKKTVIFNF